MSEKKKITLIQQRKEEKNRGSVERFCYLSLSSYVPVPSGKCPSFTGRFLCSSWLAVVPPGDPLSWHVHSGHHLPETGLWRSKPFKKDIKPLE